MHNAHMHPLPCRSAGGGRPQKGRDLHGTAVIPKLVAFLVLPAEVLRWMSKVGGRWKASWCKWAGL